MTSSVSPNLSPNACINGGRPDVTQLWTDRQAMSSISAVMFKLTDECIAAIRRAQKMRLALRIRLEQRDGVIEVGSGEQMSKFRFVVQQVPGPPADAVLYDREKRYRTIATYQSKIQVQTTENALAETREKAQKLMEEEKRKKLSESSKQKREQRPVTVKRATNPLAIGAQRPSPTPLIRSHQSDSTLKCSSLKVSSNQTNSNSSAAGARSLVRAELSRRPLRKRVIHLVVLARFYSVDEIIAQYRKDSISEENAQEDAYRIQEIVDEVADVSRDTGRLQLKQAYYNEVDARWPGFCSEEKSYVRKILSSNMGNITNFAPTRKSGIAPMLAPSSMIAGHGSSAEECAISDNASRNVENKTPESVPSKAGKSPAGATNVNTRVNENKNQNNDDLNMNVSKVKRKAHKPSGSAKRARQQSLSPPEDPSNANFAAQSQTKNANPRPAVVCDRVSESTNLPISSIPTPVPTQDWSKVYSEVHSFDDAKKYYVKFLEEYPIYLNCFNRLTAVAEEFKTLHKQLMETPENMREYQKLERAIQAKYMHYRDDSEFQAVRQRHADLRAKLIVIKERIATWESHYTKEQKTKCMGGDTEKYMSNDIAKS